MTLLHAPRRASSAWSRLLALATLVVTPTLACGPADAPAASTASPADAESAPLSPEDKPVKAPHRPFNVLLVTLDTTRADHLSCYEPRRATSSNYDQLAREGVRFSMCISTAAITPVSHASILTGLNPYRHGVRVLHAASGFRLSESVPTLASVLRGAGWRTGAFLSAFPVSEHFGFDQGFEHFDYDGEAPTGKRERSAAQGLESSRSQRRADVTVDRTLDWLRATPERFFAWVHLFDPHDAQLKPPQEVQRRFEEGEEARGAKLPSLYDVEIYFGDQEFGRIVSLLKESGRYDDTLIVITADHGEGLGEHDWHSHRLLYQEQLEVPLIVKLPGGPSGLVIDPLVRTIDIYPTVIEFLGGDVTPEIEGKSLLGLVRGEKEPPRIAYADQLNLWDTRSEMRKTRKEELLHCVIEHPWKLIYRPQKPELSELYNLESDRDESFNLYAQEPKIAQRLLSELESRQPFVLKPFGAAADDSKAADALKDLGY